MYFKLFLSDIIGHIRSCEDLDAYDKNGKAGKKKSSMLVDAKWVLN